MHPLAKRISLVVSFFCLVLGIFLLCYNMGLITDAALGVVLNLWPSVLIIAGALLLVDSLMKRRFTRSSMIQSKEFRLPAVEQTEDILCRVSFSYGKLAIGSSTDGPVLTAERIGHMADPTITRETRGGTTVLSIALTKPFFPSYFQLLNTWQLGLPRDIPTRLELNLHEAALAMDLRRLSVESVDIRAGSGKQEILFGRLQKRLEAQVYSSSTDLSIVVPSRVRAEVILLNPFCRIDYPQGDFERREDGSLVSASCADGANTIVISIDGPLKNLVLDVEDADIPET